MYEIQLFVMYWFFYGQLMFFIVGWDNLVVYVLFGVVVGV